MAKVLYCVMNPCCMSKALVHRLDVNKNKDAVLLVDRDIFQQRELLNAVDNMKKKKIFNDVIYDRLFFDSNKQCSIDEYQNYVIEFYNTVFSNHGYSLSDFDEVITANDCWDGRVNVYFNIMKKKYIWLQTDPNNLQENIEFQCSTECKELFNYYRALSPFAPYAIPWMASNCKKVLLEKVENVVRIYDYGASIKTISDKIVEDVVMCYGMKDITKDNILFLPNSYGKMYARLTGMQKEYIGFDFFGKEEMLYQKLRIACDYFLTDVDEIMVKPHPNDPITNDYLQKIMGNKIHVLTEAPWEWAVLYLKKKNVKFKSIIGFASTSLDAIDDDICENKLALGDSFYKIWYFYDQIICIIEFLKEKYNHIVTDEIMLEQIEKYCNGKGITNTYQSVTYNKINRDTKHSIIFVDGFEALRQGVNIQNIVNGLDGSSTLVLFNMDKLNQYIEVKKGGYVSGIQITYKGEDAKYIDLYEKSNIYIISQNKEVHLSLHQKKYEKYMPNRRIVLSAKILSDIELAQRENNLKLGVQVKELKEQSRINQERINNLMRILVSDRGNLISRIHEWNDMSLYLDILQIIKDDCVIILAVKDTVGDCLSDCHLQQLKQLGFFSINKETWRMYIGVSTKEFCIDKVADAREEPLNETLRINNHLISISSNSWRRGNYAKIAIDGIDYAANIRGINIVVLDKATGKVIDSVGYDSHTSNSTFVRKKIENIF